jgi:hypothetical protein
MFRKLLLTALASLGLLSPLALVPVAGAHEYRHEWHHGSRHERRHECDWQAFYRDPCRPGWVCAGTFEHRREAERFAEQYRCRGFEVSIR